MSASHSWLVITEEGRGNTNIYEFECTGHALEFFRQRWVACLLVEPDGREVSASSGCNPFPFVLQRLRSELLTLQKGKSSKWRATVQYQYQLQKANHSSKDAVEVAEDLSEGLEGHGALDVQSMCSVVVEGLSGRVFDTQFPKSATIRDVKGRIECAWGLLPIMQKMMLETSLLEDHDTIGILLGDCVADTAVALHLQMITDSSSIQQHYKSTRKKINDERAKPTNVASMKKLRSLLEQADTMEEAMTQKGIPVGYAPGECIEAALLFPLCS